MHVKTGTWIIAIVQLVLVILGVIQGVVQAWRAFDHDLTTESKLAYVIQAVCLICFLFLVILLILGLYRNRARLVLPHLIASIVMVILMVVEMALIIAAGGLGVWNIVFTVLFVIFILFCIWVEWRCYQYLNNFA